MLCVLLFMGALLLYKGSIVITKKYGKVLAIARKHGGRSLMVKHRVVVPTTWVRFPSIAQKD